MITSCYLGGQPVTEARLILDGKQKIVFVDIDGNFKMYAFLQTSATTNGIKMLYQIVIRFEFFILIILILRHGVSPGSHILDISTSEFIFPQVLTIMVLFTLLLMLELLIYVV